jgi:hypothetical protein
MTTYPVAQHRVHLSKKFGLITHEQVLLLKGGEQQKLDLKTISSVHLIKKRNYIINLLMGVGALLLWTVMGWNGETLPLWGIIVMAGLGTLLGGYATAYRFHDYTLRIRRKDLPEVCMHTTQWHHADIKTFYTILCQKTRENHRAKN